MYNKIHFTFNNTIISNEVIINNYSEEKIVLQHITIFGIQNKPIDAQVNGKKHTNYLFNTTEKVSNFVSLLILNITLQQTTRKCGSNLLIYNKNMILLNITGLIMQNKKNLFFFTFFPTICGLLS